MQIFGWSLFNRDPNPDASTKVIQEIPELADLMDKDQSALWELVGKLRQVSDNRKARNEVFQRMSHDSTVSAALEMMAEDATQIDYHENRIFWPEAEDEAIQKDLEDFLFNTVKLDTRLFSWALQVLIFGEMYLKTFYSERKEAKGIINKVGTDAAGNTKLEKLNEAEREKTEILKADEFYEEVTDPSSISDLIRFGNSVGFLEDSGSTKILYPVNDFIHFCSDRSLHREEIKVNVPDKEQNGKMVEKTFKVKIGTSFLEGSVQSYNIIELLEDVLVTSRLSRSTLFRLFMVNVGAASNTETVKILKEVKNSMASKETMDFRSGGYSSSKKNIPMGDSIFIPTRSGKGEIQYQNIGGDVDVRSIVDFDYFYDKFVASLKVPRAYLACLRGDTRISLLDGTTPTVKEMAENFEYYVGRSILTCDANGEIRPTEITHATKTRLNASFVRVHLDNGEWVDVTPDHKFQMRDGGFKEAGDLIPQDSLMPFYSEVRDYGGWKGYSFIKRNKNNHKVVRVEVLDIVEDAYDIGVADEAHTFPLASGVFVHNSEPVGGQYSNTSLTRLDIRYARTVSRIVVALKAGVYELCNNHFRFIGKEEWVDKFELRSVRLSNADETERLNDIETKANVASGISQLLIAIEGAFTQSEQKLVMQELLYKFVGIEQPDASKIVPDPPAEEEEEY